MSSSGKGAATAAPALAELADQIRAELDAIEGDSRSALGHAIVAGEKLREAKAHLGHGEWLSWLEANFPAKRSTAGDYMRLAANYQRAGNFTSIREALAALPKRAKSANPNGNRARSRADGSNARQAWKNDDVIAWTAKRVNAGAKVDDLVRDSAAGRYGWPMPDQGLGQNAAEKCRAIVEDRASRGDTTRPRKPKESGRRLRKLHDDRRAGIRAETDLWYLQVAVSKAVGVLEGFKLPDLDWSESTEALVAEIHDDLERHVRWTDTALDAVVAHMDELGRRRKIQVLDARAHDPSSTANERATAARLAERLRARGHAAQLGDGA